MAIPPAKPVTINPKLNWGCVSTWDRASLGQSWGFPTESLVLLPEDSSPGREFLWILHPGGRISMFLECVLLCSGLLGHGTKQSTPHRSEL